VNPWLEVFVALIVILASGALGWRCSRLPKGWWLLGYIPPLAGALAVAVATRKPEWALHPLLSWIFIGRLKVLMMGAVVAMLFSALIPRLPRKRDRMALGILTVVAALYVGVWPGVATIANREKLAHLETKLDGDGVCRQSTDYTCGPAAAVTGLRILGIQAQEGELAILARTSTATGTPPDILASVLSKRYAAERLKAEFRRFRTVSELRGAEPVLVLIQFMPMLDHWICVVDVTDTEIVVADPLNGMERWSHEKLADRWRNVGIALSRK
jgi:predicted double-glycine peptidase